MKLSNTILSAFTLKCQIILTGNFIHHKRFGDLSILITYVMNKSKLNNEDIKEFYVQ